MQSVNKWTVDYHQCFCIDSRCGWGVNFFSSSLQCAHRDSCRLCSKLFVSSSNLGWCIHAFPANGSADPLQVAPPAIDSRNTRQTAALLLTSDFLLYQIHRRSRPRATSLTWIHACLLKRLKLVPDEQWKPPPRVQSSGSWSRAPVVNPLQCRTIDKLSCRQITQIFCISLYLDGVKQELS